MKKLISFTLSVLIVSLFVLSFFFETLHMVMTYTLITILCTLAVTLFYLMFNDFLSLFDKTSAKKS